MKKCLIILFVAGIQLLTAQVETEKKWVFGIHGGFNQYNGELGNGWYVRNQAAYSFAGISFTRFLNNHWDLTFLGTQGEIGYQSVWEQNRPDLGFLVRKTDLQLFARYYLLGRQYFFQPFVMAGGGLLRQRPRGDTYYASQPAFDYAVPSAGLGFNIRITRWMRFQLQEIFTHTSADYVDYRQGGYNDLYVMHCAGLIFNFPGFAMARGPEMPEVEVDKCPPLLKDIQKRRKEKKRQKTKARMDRKKA